MQLLSVDTENILNKKKAKENSTGKKKNCQRIIKI